MTEAIYTNAAGVNFTAPSGSASASASIPVDASGQLPKYIRVSIASGAIYFKQDPTSATAVNTDPIIGASDSQILKVTGAKFSAYGIGASITGVVTPLENAR